MDIRSASQTPPPERHPIEFTASGSEYFRIWIVNLLLIVVTLGIYLPWAKVRKLKYFYSNTWVGGDALDFHGEPVKMLRGTLIAAGFLIAYSVGSNFSGWAGTGGGAGLRRAVAGPVPRRDALPARQHQLAGPALSFRRRHGRCLRLHAAAAGAGPAAGGPRGGDGRRAGATARPAGPAGASPPAWSASACWLFMAGLPYFLWRVRRYQHDNYAIGAAADPAQGRPGRALRHLHQADRDQLRRPW